MVEKAGETNVESLRLHTQDSVELEVDSGGQMAGAEAAEALVTFAGDSVRWKLSWAHRKRLSKSQGRSNRALQRP